MSHAHKALSDKHPAVLAVLALRPEWCESCCMSRDRGINSSSFNRRGNRARLPLV
jgi:hypothetical protein